MDNCVQKNKEEVVEINDEPTIVTPTTGFNDSALEQINNFVDIIHSKMDIFFKHLAQIKRELENDIEYTNDGQQDLSVEFKRKINALEFVEGDSIENLFK
jgi:regulator of PEP synthase PpsR (kinase-PPPase family)